MKYEIEQLRTTLNVMKNVTDESILKILHDDYLENSAADTGEMNRRFDRLDQLLNELTPDNYDRIWSTSMALCSDHERRGFDAGFRMAVSLMRELSGGEQEN